ncbi:hypothetical protein ADK60_20105 [Streptomyces sp. XY431]|nr:hypothetical protein ADK60_20105 [Streptomyces sp. XY431]
MRFAKVGQVYAVEKRGARSALRAGPLTITLIVLTDIAVVVFAMAVVPAVYVLPITSPLVVANAILFRRLALQKKG